MKIDLSDFVEQLQQIRPGLSPRAITEQSDHFVFKDGKIITYNEEVMCSTPTPLKIHGTTPADQLLEQIRKFSKRFKVAGIQQVKNQIKVATGPKNWSMFRLNRTISLPVEEVDQPKKWVKVKPEFTQALQMVVSCASTAIEQSFMLVCVHMTPEFVEACDAMQTARYKIKLPFKNSMLVRKSAIVGAVGLDITAISVTKSWLHMRDESGLTYSCRRYIDPYRSLDDLFKMKGQKIVLPTVFDNAVEYCNTFSKQNPDDYVTIRLSKGRMLVETTATRGSHHCEEQVKYSGPDLAFSISPSIVREIMNRGNRAIVNKSQMKVVAGPLTYLTCLGVVE